MAGSFTFMDHTADRRLKVKGDDLESLFIEGVKGLAYLLQVDMQKIHGASVKRTIDIEAPDTTSLLIDFLSEVLTYTHIDKSVYEKVQFEFLEPRHLKARIFGHRVEGFAEEVKAVTYHEAEVSQVENGTWESMVIFDI